MNLPVEPNFAAFPVANDHTIVALGLTKREYFASQILAGLVANANNMTYEFQISRAVKAADMLIEELNKSEAIAQDL